MADKSKRGPAPTSVPKKIAADPEGFSTRLVKLTSELGSLCRDTDGLKEYGKLLDGQTALRNELSQKNHQILELQQKVDASRREREEDTARLQAEIAEARKYHDRLSNDYNTRFRSWDADASRHATDAAELARLTGELEAARTAAQTAERENRTLRDKVTKQAKQLQDSQNGISALKDERQMQELQIKKMQNELETCRKTLRTLKDDLGILSMDREKTQQRLEDLATSSQKLVQLHFAKEIANPSTSVSDTPPGRIPLLASNSPAALATRCAFAEAVIAQELMRHVFKDFFVPENAGVVELGGLIKAIAWLNERRPLEATIIRCQLARACYELDDTSAVSARAAEAVRTALSAWLDDENAESQFEGSLVSFFAEAVKLWRNIQRTSKRVKAVVDVVADEWFEVEDSRPEYDRLVLGEEHRPQQAISRVTGPVAVLFPQIFAAKELLFHGYALFPTQSAVIAAVQERDNMLAPSPARRRRSNGQGGRASSSAVNGLQLGTSSDLSYSGRSNV